MIRVNPFTGDPQLVNESAGGGHPTALYDADGNVVASVDGDGNVVFTNGFSTTGDFYGDLIFDGGQLTGNCNIDITGGITAVGATVLDGTLEVDSDTNFYGVVNFPNAQIDADGSASFAGGYINWDSDGTINLPAGELSAGGVLNLGNLYLNQRDGNVWIDGSDGSASFAVGTFTIDAFGNVASSNGYMALGNGDGTNTIILDGSSDGSIQSVNWSLNNDGSASFAGGVIHIYDNGSLSVGNGIFRVDYDGADIHCDANKLHSTDDTWVFNPDGSASFAGGGLSIGADGQLDIFGGNITLRQDGSSFFQADAQFLGSVEADSGNWTINTDGSASFAGGNIQFDHDGTTELASGLSMFFIDGTVRLNGIPTGDPHDAGQVYQDAVTHALFISQG